MRHAEQSAWAAIAFAVMVLMPGKVGAAEQLLLLDVQVNGRSIGKVGEFTLRDGVLLARRDELKSLGFRVPPSSVPGPGDLVVLSTLPDLTLRLDQANQALHVTADNDRLLPTVLAAGAPPDNEGTVESSTGATLDYSVNGTSAGRQNVASGLLDLRVFSPWGVASSGLLAYAGGGPGGPGATSAIRLDTTYALSDPDTLRRYRVGDFVTGSLAWTRPVRLGGVQVSLDFGIRPDLVTFPLPSVSGAVAIPSTVDVLVNDTRLFSGQVEAGPFQIPQLPVVTGAGTISTTLTNALGRQVVATLPFYASSALLAPGLQAFSVQAGAVRRNWGLVSNDYGDLAASATYRRGLSPAVTLEAGAEGGGGVFMAGGGAVVNVGNLALLNMAAAASTSSGRPGTQLSVGLQRAGPVLSLGASAIIAGRGFRDIATVNGDPIPQVQIRANAGLSLGRLGSVGAAYVGVDRDAPLKPVKLYVPPGSVRARNAFLVDGVAYLQPAQHAHVLSASYSVQVRNLAIYATGFHDFANRNSSGLLVGVTIPLGGRSSSGASVGSGAGGNYAQVQATQSPVAVGDWGYQVAASSSNPAHEFAQLQYKSPWTLLSAGVDRVARQSSLRLESQGSVSLADGEAFASNIIEDSFAVVDTNGLGNVRVFSENRAVGRTNAAGRLLVPDLRSFSTNHLSIEPTDVPSDTEVGTTTRNVRPQDRSGVVVKFPVRVSHGALLHLVDEAGKAVPVGSTATLRATGVTVPVGYDGAAYVQDLGSRNALAVEQPGGRRCDVAFDYRPVPGGIPTIGPLRCQERKP